MARKRGADRRTQRAGALSVNDPEATDTGDRGVVEIAIEHVDRLIRSRTSDIEL